MSFYVTVSYETTCLLNEHFVAEDTHCHVDFLVMYVSAEYISKGCIFKRHQLANFLIQ